MPNDLDEHLRDFAQQARALADQIQEEGGRPSARGPGGMQARVNVLLPSPEHPLVGQLRSIAEAIVLYLQERQIEGSGPPGPLDL